MAIGTTNNWLPWVVLVIVALLFLLIGGNYIAQNNDTLTYQPTPTPLPSPASPTPLGTMLPSPSPTASPMDLLRDVRNQVISFQQRLDKDVPEDAFIEQVRNLRQEINTTSQTADTQARSQLQALDRQLEAIETQSRQDLAAALNSLKELVDQLKKDIADDQDGQPID